jgi:hypothetical protein
MLGTVACLALGLAPPPALEVYVLTDCTISRQYAPELRAIHKAYGVPLTVVFEDSKLTQAQAARFLKDFGLDAKIRLDSSHKEARSIAVTMVPTAVVWTRKPTLSNGNLAYIGRIDDRFPRLGDQRPPRRRDLRIALDELAKGSKVSVPRTQVVGCLLPL